MARPLVFSRFLRPGPTLAGVAALGLAVLLGCGGGGNGGGTPAPAPLPSWLTGAWVGNTTDPTRTRPVYAQILADGTLGLLDTNNPNLAQGKLTLTGNALSGSGGFILGNTPESVTFTGTAAETPAQVQLTVARATNPLTFTLSPDTLANVATPLAALAGSYTSAAGANNQFQSLGLTVNGDGTATLTFGSSAFAGTLVQPTANLNAFKFRFPGLPLGDGTSATFSGNGYLRPAQTGTAPAPAALVLGLLSDRSDAAVYGVFTLN